MERLTKRDKDGTAIAPEFADKTYIMQDDHDRFTGYISSPIVDRLAELEDKLESGRLLELPTIISFPNLHPTSGKITTYQVVWLSKLLGIRHEEYITREQAEQRLKELQEKL